MTRVSPEFARCYALFRRAPDRWYSNEEVAAQAAVSARTARLVTRTLAEAGLLDVARLSPSFRFRARLAPCDGNGRLLQTLEDASQILGVV